MDARGPLKGIDHAVTAPNYITGAPESNLASSFKFRFPSLTHWPLVTSRCQSTQIIEMTRNEANRFTGRLPGRLIFFETNQTGSFNFIATSDDDESSAVASEK